MHLQTGPRHIPPHPLLNFSSICQLRPSHANASTNTQPPCPSLCYVPHFSANPIGPPCHHTPTNIPTNNHTKTVYPVHSALLLLEFRQHQLKADLTGWPQPPTDLPTYPYTASYPHHHTLLFLTPRGFCAPSFPIPPSPPTPPHRWFCHRAATQHSSSLLTFFSTPEPTAPLNPFA